MKYALLVTLASIGLMAGSSQADIILTPDQALSGRGFVNPAAAAPGENGFSFLQAPLNTNPANITVGDTEGLGDDRFGMVYIMAFTITQEFFDATADGNSAMLTFDSISPINGGAPGPIALTIIARNATQSFGNTNVFGAYNPNVFGEDVVVDSNIPAGTANQTFDVSLWLNTGNIVVGENVWFALSVNTADMATSDNGVGNQVQFGTTPTLSIVPEPGSMALLGLGGLMILSRRRAA